MRPAISLNYNYHRYYDPSLGRYITSDPIGLENGLNTYGYVGSNPLNRIDPTGENWLGPLIGAGIIGYLMWEDGKEIKKNSDTIYDNIYNKCPEIPEDANPFDKDPKTGRYWIDIDRSQTRRRIAETGRAITNIMETASPIPSKPRDLADKAAENLAERLLKGE